jgi:CMP-N-acetylneuraminic acid synthetase
MNNILVVIPARGGSKGIPRKNLRMMDGKPLIHYSINTALKSIYKPDVYVSTEDEEIALISEKLGASIVKREPDKAGDKTTLDPVIYDCMTKAEAFEGKDYQLIVTLQPTSPLLRTESLDKALRRMLDNDALDTIFSAVNDTHLTWRYENGRYLPNYRERLNRQYLTPTFKETGGFLITRKRCITENSRIGEHVELFELHGGEAVDIDSYEDWSLCEHYNKRKRILFVVSGYQQIGLGHVYNSLIIANDILDHQIEFLVDSRSQLAFEKIASKNYTVYVQERDNLVRDIEARHPDIVINDRLDTEAHEIRELKRKGMKVINFEDLGEGAKHADLVINAIHPERQVLPDHYFGHDYVVLRDEFILTQPKPICDEVSSVLLTFGGVDPDNLTKKVLQAIHGYCQSRGIEISVVTGFGYQYHDSLNEFKNIRVFRNTMSISDHMAGADIAFTSAGRTTYEIASLEVPCIVLAQNERELSHLFASAEFGFLNLGHGKKVDTDTILEHFVQLVKSASSRRYMASLMSRADLASGRKRVQKLIRNVLEG